MFERLGGVTAEYAELEKALADPGVHANQERARGLGKRYAELSPVVHAYQEWQRTIADEAAARELAAEDSSFADEAEQLGEQNNAAHSDLLRVNLPFQFVQPFERSVRVDMHRTQPRHFRVGQRERARQERAKSEVAHECHQRRTQLLTDATGRRGFCPGRFIFQRLISNETLAQIPHLWSGSVHLEISVERG